MRTVHARVRQVAVLFALSTPVMATGAQVALQVKSGTTWTSTLELRALGPVTFRWRWDGAETPSGVAWQLATVAPVSTATTRGTDVIATETPLRLPAASDVKGGYQEFTVNPESSWPPTFYVRMRVNLGRQSVYSRWVPISVVQRTSVAANPTCTVEASQHRLTTVNAGGAVSPITTPILAGEKVSGSSAVHKIRVRFRNRLTTPVSYRRDIKFSVDGKPRPTWFHDEDPQKTLVLAPSQSDTFEHMFSTGGTGLLAVSSGVIRMVASVNPLSGTSSECFLEYVITP